MSTYNKLPGNIKLIMLIQGISLLMGTSTHIVWVIQNGLLSEKYNAWLPTMIFWDSLTILDPLAAALLFIRPKTGLILTLIIIVVDVIHNNWFYFDELYTRNIAIPEWIEKYWMILGQLLFASFVLITFKRCFKAINSVTSSN